MPRSNHLSLLLLVALCASFAFAQSPRGEAPKPVALSLREAVARALENSRDIEVERLNVQKNEFDVKAAHGAYDPTFSSSLSFERRNTPVASILAGGENGKLTTNDLFGQAKLARKMPWQGGSMSVSLPTQRNSEGFFLFFSAKSLRILCVSAVKKRSHASGIRYKENTV